MPSGGRAKDNKMPPSWKSDEFLAGEIDPKAWLDRTGLPHSEGMEAARPRHDAIEKLRARGPVWFDDPDHYRNWPKYCKCQIGTVDDHNKRVEKALERVDDGR